MTNVMSTILLIFGRLSSDVVEYGPLRWDAQACERFGSGPHSDNATSRDLALHDLGSADRYGRLVLGLNYASYPSD